VSILLDTLRKPPTGPTSNLYHVKLKVGTHHPYVRPGRTAVFFAHGRTGRTSGPYRPDVRPVGFTRTIPEALYDVTGDVIIHILHILRCYYYFNNAMGRTGNRKKTLAFFFLSSVDLGFHRHGKASYKSIKSLILSLSPQNTKSSTRSKHANSFSPLANFILANDRSDDVNYYTISKKNRNENCTVYGRDIRQPVHTTRIYGP